MTSIVQGVVFFSLLSRSSISVVLMVHRARAEKKVGVLVVYHESTFIHQKKNSSGCSTSTTACTSIMRRVRTDTFPLRHLYNTWFSRHIQLHYTLSPTIQKKKKSYSKINTACITASSLRFHVHHDVGHHHYYCSTTAAATVKKKNAQQVAHTPSS